MPDIIVSKLPIFVCDHTFPARSKSTVENLAIFVRFKNAIVILWSPNSIYIDQKLLPQKFALSIDGKVFSFH